MNEKPLFHCELDITGTGNGEWQGVVRTDGETREFGSVMELLRLIWSEVGPPMDGWPGG